jgi:hypothetical protein
MKPDLTAAETQLCKLVASPGDSGKQLESQLRNRPTSLDVVGFLFSS